MQTLKAVEFTVKHNCLQGFSNNEVYSNKMMVFQPLQKYLRLPRKKFFKHEMLLLVTYKYTKR